MAKKKHIATYPLFGSFPISARVDTSNRIGTGYIYEVSEIDAIEKRLMQRGHPLRIRWRNDECWREALASMKIAEEERREEAHANSQFGVGA